MIIIQNVDFIQRLILYRWSAEILISLFEFRNYNLFMLIHNISRTKMSNIIKFFLHCHIFRLIMRLIVKLIKKSIINKVMQFMMRIAIFPHGKTIRTA